MASLKQTGLENFHGLSGHPALGFLWIEACPKLGTLEWLGGMERLETLRILDCGKIVGIEVFRSLHCLRHLHIHGAIIVAADDFTFLRNLQNIESVVLKEMSNADIEYWKKRSKRYDLLRSDLAQRSLT
jgi:hypothetical protein